MSERISPELPEINPYELSVPTNCQECPILKMDIERFEESVNKYDSAASLIMNPQFASLMRQMILRRNPEYSDEELSYYVESSLSRRRNDIEKQARHLSLNHDTLQSRIDGATEECTGLGVVEDEQVVPLDEPKVAKFVIDYCRSRAMPDSAIVPARVTRKPIDPKN